MSKRQRPMATWTCRTCGFTVTSDTHIRFDELCGHYRPAPGYTYPYDTYAALIGDEPIPEGHPEYSCGPKDPPDRSGLKFGTGFRTDEHPPCETLPTRCPLSRFLSKVGAVVRRRRVDRALREMGRRGRA